jgi:hypothetical protein
MPDNGSSAKIDPAAITESIRQWIKDLDAEVERVNAAREAMPPPIDRAATSIRLTPHRRASSTARPSDERQSKWRQKPAAPADD